MMAKRAEFLLSYAAEVRFHGVPEVATVEVSGLPMTWVFSEGTREAAEMLAALRHIETVMPEAQTYSFMFFGSSIGVTLAGGAITSELLLSQRPVSVKSIAENTGIKRPTATIYVSDLIAIGMAERRNGQGVNLTKLGQAITRQMLRDTIAISMNGQVGYSRYLLSSLDNLDRSKMKRPFKVSPDAASLHWPALT